MNYPGPCLPQINSSSCCKEQDLILNITQSPCGLRNKPVFPKLLESLTLIHALFSLFPRDDVEEKYLSVPTITLEIVDLTNFYLLQNESGWQTLIKTSVLPSRVNITNVVFRNNYKPLGIFKQLTFNQDPYFRL